MEPPLRHSYTCVFRGARDHYQAAVALSEVGRLDKLVTDFYTPDVLMRAAILGPSAFEEFWQRRHSGMLASRFVTNMPFMALPLGKPWSRTDRVAARMGAKAADLSRDAALVYSYHWQGFHAALKEKLPGPRVIFQVHPISRQVRSILEADRAKSGVDDAMEAEERRSAEAVEEEEKHLRTADGFLTASSFVREGLTQAGVPRDAIQVAPYGADRLTPPPSIPPRIRRGSGPLKLLWVGQLAYRKGPHWLFEALRSLTPGTAELTIVTRSELPKWLGAVPAGTRVIAGPTDVQLAHIYAQHDLFVMPSLVEGFGLVYLEALNAGVPVIGTSNTGLPDVAQDGSNALLVEPGNAHELAATLDMLFSDAELLGHLSSEARSRALPNWGRFRSRVRAGLGELEKQKVVR